MNDSPTPNPSQGAPPLPGVRKAGEILPGRIFSTLKLLSDEEWAAREKLRQAELRRGRIEWLERQSNAPKRQWNAKDLDRSGPWGETEKKILEKLGKGGLFIGLVGLRGNGKTQLAVEAMRYVIRELALPAYFVTAAGFIGDLKACFGHDAVETERDVIRRYARYQLLGMDEFGRRGETEWENNQLFELLNKRYNDQKDTILISNQERDEFIRAIGDSLASRMKETGAILPCEWKSYR